MLPIIRLFLKHIGFLEKSICKECKYKDKDKISDLCLYNPKITKNYYNGEITKKYSYATDKNPNGNCSHFIKINNDTKILNDIDLEIS